MDESSTGRKSMSGADRGLCPVLKERQTMGIGGGVLPYLHMIFPVLPARFARRFAGNNGYYLGWKVNVTVRGGIHHQPLSSAAASCPLRLYELPHKVRALTTRTPLRCSKLLRTR